MSSPRDGAHPLADRVDCAFAQENGGLLARRREEILIRVAFSPSPRSLRAAGKRVAATATASSWRNSSRAWTLHWDLETRRGDPVAIEGAVPMRVLTRWARLQAGC